MQTKYYDAKIGTLARNLEPLDGHDRENLVVILKKIAAAQDQRRQSEAAAKTPG